MLSRFALLSFLLLPATCIAGRAQNSAPPDSAHHFYVDCSAAHAGNAQSPQSRWNTLAALNIQHYSPGDVIAIRRGTTCHGQLTPSGSGAEGAPIRLTAYGAGPPPKIVADPKADEVLRLFNQEYWDIDSLDLSGGHTYGIFISGDNGVLHHIHLANLAVHDVQGGEMKHKESGLVTISPETVNARFDDVVVDGVTAWNTNQWVGIMVGGGNLGFPPDGVWSFNGFIRKSDI